MGKLSYSRRHCCQLKRYPCLNIYDVLSLRLQSDDLSGGLAMLFVSAKARSHPQSSILSKSGTCMLNDRK